MDELIMLRQELLRLKSTRNSSKVRKGRTHRLFKAERLLIHQKTEGRCHICGQEVGIDNFQADHIKSHSKGGKPSIENFLLSCATCNNYRWDYLPEEFQLIPKIGVWSRTQIEKGTKVGCAIASGFVAHEKRRVKRRVYSVPTK